MRDVIVAAVAALIVNEVTDVSPWIAVRLVRWAAGQIYAANADRAARRKEEWEALVSESVPTKISKLIFGLSFGCAGLYCAAIRRLPAVPAAMWRLVRRSLPDAETVAGGFATIVAFVVMSLPGIVQLSVIGALVGLLGCRAGVVWFCAHFKGAADRRRPSKTAR